MKKGNFEPEFKEIVKVLIQTITQYLATNKRLVIPQLGAFIVKAQGEEIVFSELLKRDDGILRGLLQAEGQSELEAAGEIDRFTFEIRHAVEHGEQFLLEGFGNMKPGPNGIILFEYTPTRPAEQETPAEIPICPAEEEPSHESTDRQAEAAQQQPKTIIDIPKVSPSAKLNPAPYVKGLRYGKPAKNTNAYTFVNGGRRRMDRFMLIAIAAAVIAAGAIAFGFFQMSRAKNAETEQVQTPPKQSTPSTDAAATPQTHTR